MDASRIKNRVVLVALAAAAVAAPAAEPPGVHVRLYVIDCAIKRGMTPRFVVEVRALSDTVKVLKFDKRGDLRHSYARIRVTKDQRDVDIPVVISDPGPTSDADYVELETGEALTFEHDGGPLTLSQLPPGTYSATVDLQPDWRVGPVRSEATSFEVLDDSRQRDFDSNRARWSALGMKSYRYILWQQGAWMHSHAIGVTVRDREMVSSRHLRFVSRPGELLTFDVSETEIADVKSLDTIPEIFELVAQALNEPNTVVDVLYHPEYGFPMKFARNQCNAFDDEFSLSVSDFEVVQ